MEEEAKKSQPQQDIGDRRFNSLINSLADGVIALNAQHVVSIYNGGALSILDLNSALSDKPFASLITLVDKNNQPVNIDQLITATKTPAIYRDYRLVYKDKSMINLHLSVSPVKLGFGQTGEEGYVILMRDITREKSLEEEREDFISVVSHELRTPITIAEGNISNAMLLAKSENVSEKISEALRLAHEEAITLSDLINDISTLSRAERGKLTVEIESINVEQLLSDLKKKYQPEADKKGLALRIEPDANLALLKTSKLYAEEILVNFITNAIKYTQRGSVTIGATAIPGGTIFKVSDTGIGISKSDKEHVFDKFFRSEDFRTRENNGTGLGLYVTMKLAKLINAELDVESELNKGSVFSIKIPNLK